MFCYAVSTSCYIASVVAQRDTVARCDYCCLELQNLSSASVNILVMMVWRMNKNKSKTDNETSADERRQKLQTAEV